MTRVRAVQGKPTARGSPAFEQLFPGQACHRSGPQEGARWRRWLRATAGHQLGTPCFSRAQGQTSHSILASRANAFTDAPKFSHLPLLQIFPSTIPSSLGPQHRAVLRSEINVRAWIHPSARQRIREVHMSQRLETCQCREGAAQKCWGTDWEHEQKYSADQRR